MLSKRLIAPASAVLSAAVLLAGCHAQRFGQDIQYSYDTGTGAPVYFELNEDANVSPAQEGISHVWQDINNNCVTGVSGGDWGDVGSSTDALVSGHVVLTSLGTAPSAATVNCMIAEIADDPNVNGDNESLVCDDYGTNNDCQDPDGGGMGTYQIMNAETDYYQATLDNYAKVENLIVLVRDWADEDASIGISASGACPNQGARCIDDPTGPNAPPQCAAFRNDGTWITATTNGRTGQWRNVCLT